MPDAFNNCEQQPLQFQSGNLFLSSLDTGSFPRYPRDFRPDNLSNLLLTELIQRLPTIDLHRHLEGAIAPETLVPTAKKYNIPLPSYDVERLRPHIQITDQDRSLIDFLRKFDTIGNIFINPQVIEEITYNTIFDAKRENTIYLELRFSPLYMAAARQLDPAEVTEAVLAGSRRGQRELGVRTNLIMIVERQRSIDDAWQVEALAEKYKSAGVVALDLANDEFNYPPLPFAEVFQAAKRAGLFVTVHAGEAGPAQNVLTAIEMLAADRIGHGVRIYTDPAVLKLVRLYGIPLELCFTSNQQTEAVPPGGFYPLKSFLDQGLKVTLNTDDPEISGITLNSEFFKAVRHFDLSLGELHQLLLNSVEGAFLPQFEKDQLALKILAGFEEIAPLTVHY